MGASGPLTKANPLGQILNSIQRDHYGKDSTCPSVDTRVLNSLLNQKHEATALLLIAPVPVTLDVKIPMGLSLSVIGKCCLGTSSFLIDFDGSREAFLTYEEISRYDRLLEAVNWLAMCILPKVIN